MTIAAPVLEAKLLFADHGGGSKLNIHKEECSAAYRISWML